MSPGRLPPFPTLLRDLRRAARLTQEELADRARVGVRTLRDLETGRTRRPQRSTVDLLAKALSLDDKERDYFLVASRGRDDSEQSSVGLGDPGRDDLGDGAGGRSGVVLRSAPRLIGREEAIGGIASLLEFVDLVTLVGLSGIGKASLALAVGHHAADRFPGGVGGLSVTEASTRAEVLASAAASLGVIRVDDLPNRLATRPALLVVFGVDRHPGPAVAAITWLRELGTKARILATSRHPLRLPGEHLWPVLPLEVPPPESTGAEVFSFPATVLFLDRLRRVRSRPVGLAEAGTLGALVRRLGGVPLALELAAARGRVLELEEMLARYGGSTADPDPAGRSLRDAVQASWRLLTSAERECLCWLAVFQWRWSVELAEALLDGHPAAADVVALVDQLVGLGLVSARPGAQSMRFWLLDAVRAVALEQARESGLLVTVRDRHAEVIGRAAAGIVAELGRGRRQHGDDRDHQIMPLDQLAPDVQAAVDHLRGRRERIAPSLTAYLSAWRRLRGVTAP